ncbi:unnamed protein product, partial [Polarella glacialis]
DLERQLGTVLIVEASFQGDARRYGAKALPRRLVVAVEDPPDKEGSPSRRHGTFESFTTKVAALLLTRGIQLPIVSVRRRNALDYQQLLGRIAAFVQTGRIGDEASHSSPSSRHKPIG